MIISGPSGSGKTEVWRVAQKIFGNTFNIRIVDSSRITGEGWKGSYKLNTFITAESAKGGIIVFDEFDKLTRPTYNSHGENIIHRLKDSIRLT